MSWARPTCEVQSERDEAVIASQELQRFLSLHQSPKVICYRFTIEEVVDADQEVPEAKKEGIFIYLIFLKTFLLYILPFLLFSSSGHFSASWHEPMLLGRVYTAMLEANEG